MKRTFTIFLLFLLGMQISFAQGKVIAGKVTSANDGSTIPGVQVIVKGTTTGTTTDMNGVYNLTVPATATILQFSFIGMKTTEVEIGNLTTINLAMEEDLLLLDEVIVVAYGSAKKGSYTGSATQINAEKMELRPLTNISSAIEGAAAGVQVSSATGQPGDAAGIRVRGYGSINASSAPLYVVDGVPFAGIVSDINMNDVESLTILKDASSTALYGNKAANGVVMITTKKGRKGKGEMSVSVSQGITSRAVPEYDRVNPLDYYVLAWEADRNQRVFTSGKTYDVANQEATNALITNLGHNITTVANNAIVGVDGKINSSAKVNPLYSDLDWQKEIMNTGSRKNYDVSYQGGTEISDFFVSLGYLDEQGFTEKSDYQRFSGRMNVNIQPKKWFKTGLNISGANSVSNQAAQGGTSYVNPFFFSRNMGSIYPVYLHDKTTGEFILDGNGEKIYVLGNMTNLGGATRASGGSPGRHVVAETLWNEDTDKGTNLSAKTYLDINFMKDFKFTMNASLDKRNYYRIRFNNKIVGDGAPAGRGGRTSSIRTTTQLGQYLNYNKVIGDHTFSAMAAHENYEYEYNYFDAFRIGLIADGNTELINFTSTSSLTSYTDLYRTEGYFAFVNYDYQGKYYASFNYRQDGSSRFYKDNRWGDFWSVSAAWRLDQEAFIKDYTWINMLKLRTSYGQTGNDNLGSYYPYQALYTLGRNNALEPGILQSSLPATDLVWESNNQFDLALEFGLFNKLFGTIEYYHKVSDNLLFSVPLPRSVGSDNVNKNIGAMFNSGLEISLDYEVLKTKDLRWSISANIATYHNEITKMPQEEIIDGTKKLMVGHSIYDFWLRDWYGVDPDDGAALYYADNTSASTGIRIKGNDTLTTMSNNAKYHYVNSSIPDISGSITNKISYKEFELNFMFTFGIGGMFYNSDYAALMSAGNYGGALHADLLNRWQNPGDITDVPRRDAAQTSNFNAGSDRWLQDKSYLSLRTLQLTYNLPSQVANNWGVTRARAYISGENLFSLTSMKGLDPIESFNGTNSNYYPAARVITIGLNVTL